jgi:hypothetical protein
LEDEFLEGVKNEQSQDIFVQHSLANRLSKYILPDFRGNRQVQMALGFLGSQERYIQQILAKSFFKIVDFRLSFEALNFDCDAPSVSVSSKDPLRTQVYK